jgi:hypothetical protein
MLDPQHVDDESILPTDVLWRRVPDWPNFITPDKASGHYRVTSSAFDDDRDSDPMSVFLADETSIQDVLTGNEGFGIVAFTAGFARGQGQIVFMSPHDGPRGHAKVAGPKSTKIRRAFARAARWVHRPAPYDEVSLPDPPDEA